MAPRPSPPEQVRLAFVKAKLNGHPAFEDLWEELLYGSPRCPTCGGKKPKGCATCEGTGKNPRRVHYPYDTQERRDWIAALEASRESYRLAYQSLPDPASEYVAVTALLLAEGGPVTIAGRHDPAVEA